jgi:hypothetical protein
LHITCLLAVEDDGHATIKLEANLTSGGIPIEQRTPENERRRCHLL